MGTPADTYAAARKLAEDHAARVCATSDPEAAFIPVCIEAAGVVLGPEVGAIVGGACAGAHDGGGSHGGAGGGVVWE